MPALPGSAQCDAFHTARSRADLVARMYAAETGADCPVEIGASSCRDWPLPGLITERLSMRPGQLLVDAGCGTGASASGRPVPWPCAWTASASPRSLSTRPPRAAHFLASAHTRATFRVADLQNTALPTSATHGIVCIGALGRARDRDQAVAELGRVLGPGGQLVTTRPPVSLPPWVPTRQSSAVWPASAPSSLPAPPRHLALRPSCGHGGWDCFPPPDSLSTHRAEQRFGATRARILARPYRPALIIRTAAAVTLAACGMPHAACPGCPSSSSSSWSWS